jgi:hypothetical protein
MGKIYSDRPARIGWHPAFTQALRLELEPYLNAPQFHTEYPLTSEPPRVDLLVIKNKDTVIEKNIAAAFRTHNIIEYKSPGDYISIADFHRAYAYANLYLSQTGIAETELSLSFVESRHPYKPLGYLKKVRGNTVEEKSAGIYIVQGEAAAIQIIDTHRLPEGENPWLKALSEDLEIERARIILEEGEKKGGREGRIEGKIEGKVEVAQNMLAKGWPQKEVAETTGLDIKTVKSLYRNRPGTGLEKD